MKPRLGLRRARNAAPLAVVLAALAVVYAPSAIGFSGGIMSDNAGVPDFQEIGCTACHGPGPAGHADFATRNVVEVRITDPDGQSPAGNVYEPGVVYSINITLDEQSGPDAANRGGFNLRASIGTLEGVDGLSQVSDDGSEATHVNAESVEWSVLWTAPDASGPAIFDLFVNDVDGSGQPDDGDDVYRLGWYLLDDSHTPPGAVSDEEVHFGIALPQYWLGLIALASMLFVILFSFVYLKFVNPHNTDPKDR